jgi:hypothetical protein
MPTPDQPKTEWFIPTLLGGWAYGAIYRDSAERSAALAGWLDIAADPTAPSATSRLSLAHTS